MFCFNCGFSRQTIMLLYVYVLTFICTLEAVHFTANPTSEMSTDEKNLPPENKTLDKSEVDESAQAMDMDVIEEIQEKKFLNDALKTVLDPESVIIKNEDGIESLKYELEEMNKENVTFEQFMTEMDKLSLEVCKTSQSALWSYVSDANNEMKKNKMIRIAAEEDEIKKYYWNILKSKYLPNVQYLNDSSIQRKIRIIKERGTNVQMPQSQQREEIDTMQRIWSRVTICAYNVSICTEESLRSMSDVISIFKTSNNTDELLYYWKAYRDATGKKIRPFFKDYVVRMNSVAKLENFTDAGEMWRYAFEDTDFVEKVNKLWSEIKPLYDLLHNYVAIRLKTQYKDVLKRKKRTIPAHLLGNLWAQDWQSIYSKVVPYPEFQRPQVVDTVNAKDLFDAVDQFHQSLGFDSAKDSYRDIRESTSSYNCLPSSHDMCDGTNYKIKWCGEKVTDVVVGLSRAARLLGHVQYFKHYRNLGPLYRDGPNPAFHDAISDIVVIQLSSPVNLKSLSFVKVDLAPEATINNLFWLALEKLPLIAYAYVLDKWRWDVFGNRSLEDWNQHWWDLRIKETGISPPLPRNESDLDPAAKYHVVSHVQYITYLISHVLEFQILLSLCRKTNQTGPLHECTIHRMKEAGKSLRFMPNSTRWEAVLRSCSDSIITTSSSSKRSDGMSLGASEDWRTVLKIITGETELSTKGILEYFSTLKSFLEEENRKHPLEVDYVDKGATVLVGSTIVLVTILIVLVYCLKKHSMCNSMFSICGSRNGSLDIITNEMSQRKTSEEVEGISEDKV